MKDSERNFVEDLLLDVDEEELPVFESDQNSIQNLETAPANLNLRYFVMGWL